MKYYVIITDTQANGKIIFKKLNLPSDALYCIVTKREEVRPVVDAVKDSVVEIQNVQLVLGPNWGTTGVLSDDLFNRLGGYPQHVEIESEDRVTYADALPTPEEQEKFDREQLLEWFAERLKI